MYIYIQPEDLIYAPGVFYTLNYPLLLLFTFKIDVSNFPHIFYDMHSMYVPYWTNRTGISTSTIIQLGMGGR